MAHTHHHHPPCHSASDATTANTDVRLLVSMGLNLLIVLVQIIAGFMANSLALLADAVHNAGDAFALLISFVAVRIGRKPATPQKTFGYRRAEIIASFINIVLLLVMAGLLIKAAVVRFWVPEAVHSHVMLYAAIAGLLGNLLTAFLLYRDSQRSLNIKSVFLHIVADAVASVAVILGALVLMFFEVPWLDPMLTLVIAIYIVWQSMAVLKRTLEILMHVTPQYLHIDDISRQLCSIEHVQNVHHVHIWSLDEHHVFFEAHVAVLPEHIVQLEQIKQQIRAVLLSLYAIHHSTLEMEFFTPQVGTDCHCDL